VASDPVERMGINARYLGFSLSYKHHDESVAGNSHPANA
jgi:hypothetical protein